VNDERRLSAQVGHRDLRSAFRQDDPIRKMTIPFRATRSSWRTSIGHSERASASPWSRRQGRSWFARCVWAFVPSQAWSRRGSASAYFFWPSELSSAAVLIFGLAGLAGFAVVRANKNAGRAQPPTEAKPRTSRSRGGVEIHECFARAFPSSAPTSAQRFRQSFRSASGNFSSASASRIPARSGSICQF